MNLRVPPALPPRPVPSRSNTITPHSSGRSIAPPLLPPRPVLSRQNTDIPPNVPMTVPVRRGIVQRFRECFNEMSDKISPSGEYEIRPSIGTMESVVITGRKTSVFLFLSVFVSLMMTIIPVITDDTKTYTCANDIDSVEEGYCVVDSENNTSIYVFLAFYQYPWVVFLYFKTGLWVNTSGVNAKVNGLYGDYLMWDSCDISLWEKLDFLYFLDFFYYLGSLLSFFLLFFSSICTCEEDDNYGIKLTLLIAVFLIFSVAGSQYSWLLRNEGLNPKFRMKRLVKVFFFFELFTSAVVYIETYGSTGVMFLIIPVLGYIESFGFFELYKEEDGEKCCLIC